MVVFYLDTPQNICVFQCYDVCKGLKCPETPDTISCNKLFGTKRNCDKELKEARNRPRLKEIWISDVSPALWICPILSILSNFRFSLLQYARWKTFYLLSPLFIKRGLLNLYWHPSLVIVQGWIPIRRYFSSCKHFVISGHFTFHYFQLYLLAIIFEILLRCGIFLRTVHVCLILHRRKTP